VSMFSLTTIGLIGCGLGLSGTLSGLYFWFQYVKQVQIANQSLKEKNSFGQEISALRQSIKDHERGIAQLRSEHDSMLRQKDEQQHIIELRCQELEARLEEQKRLVVSQQNRVDNLETQESTLIEQLTQVTREKQDLQRRIIESAEAFSASHADILTKEIEKQKRTQRFLQERDQSLLAKDEVIKTLEAQYKTSQEELDVVRRKASGYNHMLKTLKGQKEMLEERLNHWESALNVLSARVLNSTGDTIPDNLTFGQRVTEALERTKPNDSSSHRQHGASS
jgi:chromosome segregation ATPase